VQHPPPTSQHTNPRFDAPGATAQAAARFLLVSSLFPPKRSSLFCFFLRSDSPYRFTDSLGGGIHLRRVKVRDLLSHDNVYPGYTYFVEHAQKKKRGWFFLFFSNFAFF
jgi:hypothetical protein